MSQMYNARWDKGFKDDGEHEKYFTQDEKSGEYVLKDGYEERYLGSGEKYSSGGAEATFSNDYDDMWDSYEPDRDRKNYGIFKKPEQAKQQTPAAVEAPKPEVPGEPEKDKGPIEYSPEMSQAKERVNKYQSMIDGNQGSTFGGADAPSTPQKDPQATADKYKLNLINKGLV